MIRRALTGVAALALGIAATTAMPQDAQAQRRMGSGRAADMQYVAAAGASDQYEIQSSQLAMERTRDAGVREFAESMITDHTRSTQDVTEAARRDGLRPAPPMLMPAQRNMLRQLRMARGRQFDMLYISQQRTAHSQALTLHRNRSHMRPNSALSQAAATIVPVVEAHAEHVRHMGMGGTRGMNGTHDMNGHDGRM